MVSTNQSTGVIVKSITYPRQQRDGGSIHVVHVDPADGVMRCTCKAGEFGQMCWAQKNVIAGKAGKPIIRISQRPAARRADASDDMRAWVSTLDV